MRRVSSRLVQAGLSALLVMLVAAHVAGAIDIAPLQRAEAWLYDAWLKRTAPGGSDDRVAILDIDEASLKAVGRWPWSRDTMSALMNQLFDRYGVAAVGFDVVFAEPDTSSGLDALRRLARRDLAGNREFQAAFGRLAPRLDFDARFAQSLAGRPVSLGYYFLPQGYGTERTGTLPAPALPADAFAPLRPGLPAPTGYGANLAAFQRAAEGAGFFNMRADPDGTARRMPLLSPFGAGYYLALAPSTLRVAFGGDAVRAGVERESLLGRAFRTPWIEVGGIRVPLSGDGSVYVPYRAGAPFPYVSAAQVLAGKVAPAQLENRIVLVGSTAPGLADLRVTPFSNAFPGVEIHAHLIAGMLDGTTRSTPPWARDARLLAVLVLGTLLTLVLLRVGPIVGLLATVALLALLLAAYAAAWSKSWVVPMAAPMLAVFGLYGLNTAYGFFAATRSKRQITRLFGQYVPPELADEMSRDPGHYTMEGQSRDMTVLFSDIRGFTNFSEKLPPTELAEVLNAYLSTMTRIVQEQRGTIDKYIGDAIMAFWNAPVDLADHATRAVATALAMQAALPQLNREFAARGWPELKIGIGVNTGRMSVGNMGSEFRMSYTVMGDAVNLGSRLEGITKQYGVGILVTQPTVDADPVHAFMKVDVVRVKGKETPVAIYEPLGPMATLAEAVREDAAAFAAAFAAYQKQDWDAAEAALRALNRRAPRALYDIYLERIAHFRTQPPPAGWDGVFVYTTK
ncbi:CHASE2 domain-containing protein [Thiobacillus sedimenti]|uniref:Adenylate/guanylate cyclase domain-containing protein n=1 Tax=Thiobacillus sedimenti TaxID=3110231 RepID=A0ABZ1CF78_9PROT|nr:adenylate/guanylate cyclase domain-containing protein [Thiobacillus sp. SCUT-2]WRS38027.1 adenylate/guanylate cyclase domain-containing protein [Thiobacillus sp. SCUT-2]